MGIKPEKSVNVIENKKHFYYVYAQGMLGAIPMKSIICLLTTQYA